MRISDWSSDVCSSDLAHDECRSRKWSVRHVFDGRAILGLEAYPDQDMVGIIPQLALQIAGNCIMVRGFLAALDEHRVGAEVGDLDRHEIGRATLNSSH